MLATFVIFARESLEATMIVAILLSFLRKIGRSDQASQVWLGSLIAVALDLILGVVIFETIHHYAGTRLQTMLEGSTYLIAAAILTAMSFWMKRQSRGLKGTLEREAQAAVDEGRGLALAILAGVTVGREGLETVVFMLAIAFHTRVVSMSLGAVLGLIVGFGISYWIYRLGRRIALGTFFNVFGVLLLIFGAGLVADGIEDLQVLGWLPFGQHILWHTGRYLSENSAVGDVLHTFVGYASSPTVLQLSIYVIFMVLAIYAYMRSPRTRKS